MIAKSLCGCISFDSYTKPQPIFNFIFLHIVIYLLIPTPNHNIDVCPINSRKLYIFWFLHQTTTASSSSRANRVLYIFWFLHQTTTKKLKRILLKLLYIFWFLHQTTTFFLVAIIPFLLYIFWFLHQTTTRTSVLYKYFTAVPFRNHRA